MQQYGKYYITLKGVHYEVSQEVHDAFYQAERQERYMAEKDQRPPIPRPPSGAERNVTGNPWIPSDVEMKTLSHDYLMFIPEQMDGTAFQSQMPCAGG